MAKKCLIIKSHFVWRIHDFLACPIFLGLNFFFPKKGAGDRHGSVEVRKILFKALRTSVGAK